MDKSNESQVEVPQDETFREWHNQNFPERNRETGQKVDGQLLQEDNQNELKRLALEEKAGLAFEDTPVAELRRATVENAGPIGIALWGVKFWLQEERVEGASEAEDRPDRTRDVYKVGDQILQPPRSVTGNLTVAVGYGTGATLEHGDIFPRLVDEGSSEKFKVVIPDAVSEKGTSDEATTIYCVRDAYGTKLEGNQDPRTSGLDESYGAGGVFVITDIAYLRHPETDQQIRVVYGRFIQQWAEVDPVLVRSYFERFKDTRPGKTGEFIPMVRLDQSDDVHRS